ncbi:uncharacterized protein LOC141899277 [Tubulanus polymorphus]|uniref:uncharacterized protein LOC141899277 n=1 Tax=Tubulanus polymorphus TaxID=672921 RepID=UPI003DA39D1C
MANETGTDQSPTDVTPTSSSFDRSPHTPPSIVVTRLRRTSSLESRDNPFQPDGELSREAEELLRRSTISRTQVIIDDPEKSTSDVEAEGAITPANISAVAASPTDANQNEAVRPVDIKLNDSGEPVEGEVGVVTKGPGNSLHVEHVKLKEKKKCKCCVVM